VPRPVAGAAGAARSAVWFVWRRRRARRALVAVVAALPLLGGGWWWLRDSPLVAVERVQISGVQGPNAASVEAALSSAARRMSTLDVNVGALRAAVAPFRVVESLSVSASFPHTLRIHVVEQLPVAALTVAGVRTAVAADGVVLGPALLSGSLPAIAGGSGQVPSPSGHVEDATVRTELRVLGAAPRMLLGWVARVFMDGPPAREGLTVAMRDGLTIYFGDATRPHAKWDSAVRVLADPSSAGATYVDVRVPERPAAGTTAAGGLEGGATPAQVSASDPTSAALANVLAEAVNGASGPVTTPSATGPTAAGAAVTTPGAAASGAAQSEPSAVAPTAGTAQEPQSASGASGPIEDRPAAHEAPSTSAAEPSASTSG
jgi:cell division protein FtsQ